MRRKVSLSQFLLLLSVICLAQPALAGGGRVAIELLELDSSNTIDGSTSSEDVAGRPGGNSANQCDNPKLASFGKNSSALMYPSAAKFDKQGIWKDQVKSRFRLSRVLDKVIQNSKSTSTKKQVLQSMWDSYRNTEYLNASDIPVVMPVDKRNRTTHPIGKRQEGNIDAGTIFSNVEEEIVATAVFNRFDLLDMSGRSCGEFRISYTESGKTNGITGNNADVGAFLMIVEAEYPNPQPSKGINGCMPVAKFWASLANIDEGTPDETAVEQARLLAKFFFNGIDTKYGYLPPAITYENLSGDRGQVRTNNFVNAFQWQLREFKFHKKSNGKLVLKPVTVKETPLTELYDLNATIKTRDANFEQLRRKYQEIFLGTYISDLVAPERSGIKSALGIINGISIRNHDEFNEFQSNSEGKGKFKNNGDVIDRFYPSDDNVNLEAGDSFKQKVDEIAKQYGLTATHILNRANAMTCGGCHQSAVNRNISPNVEWPKTVGFKRHDRIGFIQVGGADISPAVKDFFLPQRAKILKAFVCNEKSLSASGLFPYIIPAINLTLH